MRWYPTEKETNRAIEQIKMRCPSLTYKTTPEISGLRRDVRGQADVLVGVDQSIASKVEPTILKILI
jgi:hypothetical protein